MADRFIFLPVIIFSFLIIIPAYSQQNYQVKGQVYNTETNQPVFNANIAIVDSHIGTSSGQGGYFELMLAAGEYNIRISSLGYSPESVVLRVPSPGSKNLIIGLTPEKIEIEGVDIFGNFYISDPDNSISREQLSILPSITRISSREIEKQGAVTLTDAFKFVPGGLTETRGRKVKQFFSVRGQTYPYPDYSINGIWQKDFEETVYFFSALDIESIEIVRSSNALVKGMTGLSGVIDVRTKRPERETISLLAKYGEQNNYVTNLQYGNKINDLTFNTSTAFFGTNGPPGLRGKERIANFHGILDWEINSRIKLFAGTTYIHGLREFVSIVPPGGPLNREEQYDPLRALITYVKLNYLGNCGSLTELQTNLSYRKSDFFRHDVVDQVEAGHFTGQEEDYEYGVNLLHSRSLTPTNTLRFGALYNHFVAPEGKRYYFGRRADVHTFSGVIANEQKAGRFILDAGLRLTGGHISEWGGFSIEGSAAGFQNVVPVTDQAAPLELQSAIGITYILSKAFSMHYNIAGGTIAARRGSLNQAGLSPENEARLQHDLGLRYRSQNQNELSVSMFYTQRQDALELSGQTITTGDGFIVELYENLDKRSYGVELSTRLNVPLLHSYLFANATFMRGENETNGTFEKDEKLPNTVLNFGVLFSHSGLDANLYANYTGPYKNNRFVSQLWRQQNPGLIYPLGDFMSVDMTAGYTFGNRFSTRVFAELRNIMDVKYLTVVGYPDPGRIFMTGLRVNF